MSYDIYLKDENGNTYEVEPFSEGGTQKIGGSTETWLNVTYNYSFYYYKYIDKDMGIRWLYGKKANHCIHRLAYAIEQFPNEPTYQDYWAPTVGNAIHALKILIEWCNKFPDGVFSGD